MIADGLNIFIIAKLIFTICLCGVTSLNLVPTYVVHMPTNNGPHGILHVTS